MACTHTTTFDSPAWAEPSPDQTGGCADCLAAGERVWAHLRMCLDCGHVACCDSSPHRHASVHAKETGHAVIRSFEPGEAWRWCFLDEAVV
ncbi:MAG TPA: UBP-type zinc finger domain-containing protein [Pseudonocardia sp.]|uniref:UBP-type zinc finger domain-containing protein n=1 Tax=Pseudonocardia sp. TaxID=60912 RepID=UPI002F42AEFF